MLRDFEPTAPPAPSAPGCPALTKAGSCTHRDNIRLRTILLFRTALLWSMATTRPEPPPEGFGQTPVSDLKLGGSFRGASWRRLERPSERASDADDRSEQQSAKHRTP